jgi:hypothetical protein
LGWLISVRVRRGQLAFVATREHGPPDDADEQQTRAQGF